MAWRVGWRRVAVQSRRLHAAPAWRGKAATFTPACVPVSYHGAINPEKKPLRVANGRAISVGGSGLTVSPQLWRPCWRCRTGFELDKGFATPRCGLFFCPGPYCDPPPPTHILPSHIMYNDDDHPYPNLDEPSFCFVAGAVWDGPCMLQGGPMVLAISGLQF